MSPLHHDMVAASENFLKYLLVNPDYDKFADTMTSDCEIKTKITSYDKIYESNDTKETFLSDVKTMHFDNIVRNSDNSYAIKDNVFQIFPDKPNQLVWHVKSTQLRKGDGALEDGEHWYTLSSKMIANFDEESDQLKICYLLQEYTKTD
ncbi:MAG: hypothetical protein VX777_09680 [Chlamydiota bacterium]|nr:hypothetical protein [Chlamydiota bacterium]